MSQNLTVITLMKTLIFNWLFFFSLVRASRRRGICAWALLS